MKSTTLCNRNSCLSRGAARRCLLPASSVRRPRFTRQIPTAAGQAERSLPTVVGNSDTKQTAEAHDSSTALQTLVGSCIGGVALGYLFGPVDPSLPQAVQPISSSLGWSYFLAWSLSFYPQLIENWRRKSVTGLSPDFLMYSALGFAAYTAYTAALYFSPGVHTAYAAAHGGSTPDVQLTDFLFGAHALCVSVFIMYQCVTYGGNSSSTSSSSCSQEASSLKQQQQRLGLSKVCQLTAASVVGAVAVYCGHIGTTCGLDDCNAWLPLLYFLGYVKIGMTLVKYTPQALLNHKRQSTDGWNVNNVLLDLAGGLLSFAQIGLNAAVRSDWSVVTGNPAKLGISSISIVFDIIFVLQHYVWYKGNSSKQQLQVGNGSADANSSSGNSSSSSSAGGAVMVPVLLRAANSRLFRRAASSVVNATSVVKAAKGRERSL